MSLAKLVRGCPLFHELYEYEVEEIINDCFVATYMSGDRIIKQGDTNLEMCILLSGDAQIVVEKSGLTTNIAQLHQGDLFGEMVLINEVKRTASVISSTKTEVLILSYDKFFSFFEKNPRVFGLMVLNVTRLITKRLKKSTELIEELNNQLYLKKTKKTA